MSVPLAEQMYRYIMGQGSGFTGLLDTYTGAAAAYSVRKLKGGATNSLRVRRSSDDSEQNIGFDANGDLDTTALLAFVGTGGTDNGYVTTFYDQTGNGNNATNSTASEQPLVVSGGTLVTENGKAAVQFDGVDDELEDATVSIDSTAYSAYMVTNTTGNASRALFRNRELGGYGTQEGAAFFELISNDTLQNTFIDDGAGNAIGIANGASISDGQHLLSTEFTTSSAALYVDGTSTGTHDNVEAGSTPLASVSIPYINIGGARFSRPWSSTIQEIILFDSDQSSNRGTITTGGGTGIEGNINTYFNIV